MKKIIEVSNLTKTYGNVKAVDNISFYVEEGAFFSFLGENGAGKSTTMDMLATLLQPDSGQITIDGFTAGKNDEGIRNAIGVVFQDHMLDNLLSVKENLLCRGSFYIKTKAELHNAIAYVAEVIAISDILERPYGTLSGGQKRRCDIARALITKPKLLFLDEPTTGLDPKSRETVWESIQNIRKDRGMTVFLTTHYMEEAANCDYITVMGKGKILAKGTPPFLKQAYAHDLVKITSYENHKVEQYLHEFHYKYYYTNDTICIEVNSTLEGLNLAEKLRPYLHNIEIVNGSIESAFLNLIAQSKQSEVPL